MINVRFSTYTGSVSYATPQDKQKLHTHFICYCVHCQHNNVCKIIILIYIYCGYYYYLFESSCLALKVFIYNILVIWTAFTVFYFLFMFFFLSFWSLTLPLSLTCGKDIQHNNMHVWASKQQIFFFLFSFCTGLHDVVKQSNCKQYAI